MTDINTEALSSYAEHPIIGITGNYSDGELKLLSGYFRSIEKVGGIPLVIPPKRQADASTLDLLDRIDGLLLSGGADLNPILLGEDPIPELHGINHERDEFELQLIQLAYNRQIPMLGICRGIQMLVAALGGTVLQDIRSAMPEAKLVKHSQDADRSVATHFVETTEGSIVQHLLGKRFAVNSFHHQAVGATGDKFKATAFSSDGVIEAIESTELKSIVGVQWHPECFVLDGNDCMLPLFRYFVNEAQSFSVAKRLHQSVLTLDSHCDTPMFFNKDVCLTKRDPQLLVDFPKMREGHLDVSTMVAYLPQGARDDETEKHVIQHTFELLNEIERRVKMAPNVCLSRTPNELYDNKLRGKLSVMRGIENGYAIGRDLSNIERFAQMGVVYITLCHNGDNDICDSACCSTGEHGGLSAFGREVVKEMNRVGIMVDLSHAAETSFYDALSCSQHPIVCSHASSRTICNHPRNLTDDQLRALAKAGGVAQVTFYHGFLRNDDLQEPVNVEDIVCHIVHMIDVAGIDHVGIGTDFDGDGGVLGCASASELINLTRRLMAEGLNYSQLQKIWGENWLRVMRKVQASTVK